MHNSTDRYAARKSYAHVPRDDNLPLSIGANFHDDPLCRSTLRKAHNTLLPMRVVDAPSTCYVYSTQLDERDALHRVVGDDVGGSANDTSGVDNELRMLAYFVEAPVERDASEREVRVVCITYYTADDSIAVVERRTNNDGRAGECRVLLSRRRVPRSGVDDDGSRSGVFVTLDDFDIGAAVQLHGRTYHIVDMDARARQFVAHRRGVASLPAALPLPPCAAASSSRASACAPRRLVTSEQMDLKRIIEQQRTGIYSKPSNEDVAMTQQFYKHRINVHLSFAAVWDDRARLCGDVHDCVLRVYLQDASVEVVERRGDNSGRDGGATLLSRQRLPRSALCRGTASDGEGDANSDGVDDAQRGNAADEEEACVRAAQHGTYGRLLKSDYVTPADFDVGGVYRIFGKRFVVYDCDAFTREHVRKTYGKEMQPARDVRALLQHDKLPRVCFAPPPPTIFDAQRERADAWLTLSRKPARVDEAKTRCDGGRVMRFAARLAQPRTAADAARRFVVSFSRETDQLAVYEQPEANSGYTAGHFLARGNHRKTLADGTTVPYTDADFVVGRTLTVYGHTFELVATDAVTERLRAGAAEPLDSRRIDELVSLLRQQMTLKYTHNNDAYRALATGGLLGYKQIREYLRTCNCNVSDEEAVQVARRLIPGNTGVIAYNDFVAATHEGDGSACTGGSADAGARKRDEACTRQARSDDTKDDSDAVEATSPAAMMRTAHAAADAQRQRQLKEMLLHKLTQHTGSLKDQFRRLSGHSSTARLHRDAFRHALDDQLHCNVGARDAEVLVSMLFDADGHADELTYNQFHEFVCGSDDV